MRKRKYQLTMRNKEANHVWESVPLEIYEDRNEAIARLNFLRQETRKSGVWNQYNYVYVLFECA